MDDASFREDAVELWPWTLGLLEGLAHSKLGKAVRPEGEHVVVHDEGAYLRVLAPRICRLSRAGLEALTGRTVRFPGELEVVMSSFTGVMQLTEDDVVWRLAGEPS